MINKLPNTINAFTTSSKKTIQSLIREMKVDKTNLDGLISNLFNYKANSDYAAGRVQQLSILDRQIFIELFRDSSLKINQFFTAANSIGLAINSMIDIFDSEISKLEKDLSNLEIFINNYEFFSGKDDLYNCNYVEKFDNYLNDYRSEGFDFRIPDRDNTIFPIGGNGYIDEVSGTFKIGKNQISKNIINNILSYKTINNYENYITNSDSITNLFTETLQDSWNVTIKSPAILTSEISDYSKYIKYDLSKINGAKTILEIELINPINIDTISIMPNKSTGMQILQIILFKENIEGNIQQDNFSIGSNYIEALNQPVLLDNLSEITFSKILTKKVIFIFNQENYTRNKAKPITSELNSKIMTSFINKRLSEFSNKFSIMQDIVYFFFNKKNSITGISKNEKNDLDYYSNKFPSDITSYAKLIESELFSANNFDLQDNKTLLSSNMMFDLAKTMLSGLDKSNSLIDINSYVEIKPGSSQAQSFNHPGFLPIKDTNNAMDVRYQYFNYAQNYDNMAKALETLSRDEITDCYEYNISLRSIDFKETIFETGNEQADLNKACFVSKRIPTNGQVIALKAKINTQEEQSSLTINNVRNLNKPFSYELSISNSPNPTSELDWYPVAFSNFDSIESEVVNFDLTDFSYTPRFKPLLSSVLLYKDGLIVLSGEYSFNYVTNKLYLLNAVSYSPSSIYVVKYNLDTISNNPYEIDFVKNNIYKDTIKSYHTLTTEGEIFYKTNSNNSIKLSYVPYVNSEYVKDATYNPINGTIFANTTMGYSPVKIRMNDGSYAKNLTNYTQSNETQSFFSSDDILFVQSGKNIIFNKNILQPFTVYYSYIPNDLRFRFIIRKNLKDISIPAAADAVILKMKTATNEPYFSKLTKSTNTSQ